MSATTADRDRIGHGDAVGCLPADPRQFVADAQRVSNSADVEAALAVYAQDAVLETVADGMAQVSRGPDELRDAIAVMFSVVTSRGIQVEKELISAQEGTIANSWHGTVADKRRTRGVEIWRFDRDGKVRHQQMYTFLDVRSDRDPVKMLRVSLLYPRTAMAFLRARLTTRLPSSRLLEREP